jgi:hypothetical protein
MNSFAVELALHVDVYALQWWQPVHVVWLLVLAEMGWLGLVSLVGVVWQTVAWLGLAVWRGCRDGEVLVLAGVWLSILGLSLIDHYWWTSQQAFLAVWGVGGGTWVLRKKYIG